MFLNIVLYYLAFYIVYTGKIEQLEINRKVYYYDIERDY
jgi:hypothetical protein